MKIKRKPEKKRAAGVISGGRDSEAAEYISGLQVTEINWSRQHPSVIPHFTSLLLTRRTKILTHKVQPRVCVCPRTCRAVCEHVRCAMCARGHFLWNLQAAESNKDMQVCVGGSVCESYLHGDLWSHRAAARQTDESASKFLFTNRNCVLSCKLGPRERKKLVDRETSRQIENLLYFSLLRTED